MSSGRMIINQELRDEIAELKEKIDRLEKWESAGRAMMAALKLVCSKQDWKDTFCEGDELNGAWRQLRDCEKENACRDINGEWISIEKRLPELTQDGFGPKVLIAVMIADEIVPCEAWFAVNNRRKEFVNENYALYRNVTHWQPMPLPPKWRKKRGNNGN